MAPVKTYVALLRGINVGGRTTIPMAKLRSSLEALGLENVVTYVQSGNVVFRSGTAAGKLAADLEARIEDDFGKSVTVLVRSPAEVAKIVKANPYLKRQADFTKLHVVFLARKPAAKAVGELDPTRSPPDEFSVAGREIYLHLPNGFGRSKLTLDYFERRLGVAATARNWNTVTKLLELARA
jgi:uncharacterized protein (DUF1697 family)